MPKHIPIQHESVPCAEGGAEPPTAQRVSSSGNQSPAAPPLAEPPLATPPLTEPPLRSNDFLESAMRRWGNTVLRLALSQLRDASDAEDVFQDVFIRLLKDRTSFNDDEHLKAWLLRVTINRCRDIGRSGWKRRNEPLEEHHVALAIEAPNLLGSDIWDAIGTLPSDLRAVVHLHYVEGYSTDEVANLVGCRPSTARTRLHRARKHLKAALETADLAGYPTRSTPAGAQPASPPPATNDTPPSGKEADHEQRPLQRLCYEDARGESVRPPA